MLLNEKGLYFQGADLWMDSKRIKPFCYVSHAHADHTARHKKVICTPETGAMICHRLGNLNVERVRFDQWVTNNGSRLKLFPAGHVLGSSQILVETDDIRLVYTGDFRTAKSRTSKPATVEKCDVLVMETTYGSPQYSFPDRSEVEEEFAAYVRQTLESGRKPIVMAYALGKAQEAMAILASHDIPVTVERGIYQLSRIYERFGVDLGNYSQFRGDYFEGALIIPPHMRKFKNVKAIPNAVFTMLTGWGAGEGTRNFHGIDNTFLISDHCDYPMLLKYVEEANPRKVFTMHGFDGFATRLRERGVDAEAMEPGKEYRLNKAIHPVNIDLFE